MSTVLMTKNDPARAVGQVLTVLQKANGNHFHALKLAEQAPYDRNPAVAQAVKHLIERAAVGAGTTVQTGWASELAPVDVPRQVYLQWKEKSIVGRVIAAGARRLDS